MYSTELKNKILEILNQADRPVSAVQFVSELAEYNKSSVYRCLKSLVNKNKVVEVSVGSSKHYEKAKEAHPHFVCSICSGVTCLRSQLSQMVLPAGYKLDEMSIRGRCAGCV